MPGPSPPLLTSRRNPTVHRFRRLARGDGASDEMLLDGPHLLQEAVGAGLSVEVAVFDEHRLVQPEIAALATTLGERVAIRAASTVVDAISPVTRSTGVVSIARRPQRSLDDVIRGSGSPPLLIVAVGVQDPGNVGALIRAAEAGGATGVVVAGTAADPWSWKALRGSMGSAFRLPLARVPEVDAALASARDAGLLIMATAGAGGVAPDATDLVPPTALVLGGEGAGLDEASLTACDGLITIPMAAPVESLNVAVAAALLVYEARRQRHWGR